MKIRFLALAICALPLLANAQAAFDALKLSENELRGTSRSMSMAGAYTAVGGDISSLNQNPAGIGVYRNSDIGITMSLDFNKTKLNTNDASPSKTKFIVNNVGYVGAFRTDGDVLKNFNWGLSYNRVNEFRRHYIGHQDITTSMTNYIADQTNAGYWTEDELSTASTNPYFSDNGAPWASILAYNSYMINPYKQGGEVLFGGLMGKGTSGFAEYEVEEWGHNDEYNISLGGNFADKVYWGLGVGIFDMDYNSYHYYGEGLFDAYEMKSIKNDAPYEIVNGNASWGWENGVRSKGTGYNFKFGVIVKPINELRIGAAFHTPTYFDLRDTYYTTSKYYFENDFASYEGTEYAGGQYATNEIRYRTRTPWKFMAGLAGVIGKKGMISADYEWTGYNTMKVLGNNDVEWTDVTQNIEDYFKASHTFRIGAEYRISPSFSVRAGYSYQTSPVNDNIKNGVEGVYTVSNNPAYRYDYNTQYITCGFGYRYKVFYLDMAYVNQARNGNYHAFSPSYYTDADNVDKVDYGVTDGFKTRNNKISLTLGVRF